MGMIISISGRPGSGKSTAGEFLAQALGYRRYYMGGLRREMAKERGISLAELNRLGETDIFTDRDVDEYQRKLGETEDNFVIEGRTSFYFIPKSYKIFLDCLITEGARRIWRQIETEGNKRNEDDRVKSVADMEASLRERFASDQKRYKKYYGIDVYDLSHYDLVIDTTHLNQDEVNQCLLEEIKKHVVAAK